MRTVMATGILWTFFAAAGVQAAGVSFDANSLQPHRAVYDLSMDWASPRSGVEGLSGRFVYSFTGSECAGYTTEVRMVTDIARDYGALVTDQSSSTFEDGGSFAFSSRLFSDFVLQMETFGQAHRTDGQTIAVELEGDVAQSFELQAAVFPTEYMENVIMAARRGRHSYEAISFDGSVEEAMRTVTLIGSALKGDDGHWQWPISTAYFDMGPAHGDEAPGYTVSMLLSEDGVSRDLLMDFGDFRIAGKLTRFSPFDRVSCEVTAPALSSKP